LPSICFDGEIIEGFFFYTLHFSKLYSIALPKKKFTMAKISAFLMEGAEF
jgi:hypothetical protein